MTIENANIGYNKSLFTLAHLQLMPKEIVCILGENGCGKSTLLQSLAGFIPLISGNIKKDKNCRIAFLGSKSQSHPQLKVFQALLLAHNRDKVWFKNYSEEQKKECEDLLIEFNMLQLKDKYINELSDGQMQKLWLGQALLSNPDILFLDEPTGHLDANNTAFIFKKLRQWASKKNKSIILSSHKIDWILQISDRFLLIENQTSKIFTKDNKDLVPALNRCFSGDYHSVDFNKNQYQLKLENKN